MTYLTVKYHQVSKTISVTAAFRRWQRLWGGEKVAWISALKTCDRASEILNEKLQRNLSWVTSVLRDRLSFNTTKPPIRRSLKTGDTEYLSLNTFSWEITRLSRLAETVLTQNRNRKWTYNVYVHAVKPSWFYLYGDSYRCKRLNLPPQKEMCAVCDFRPYCFKPWSPKSQTTSHPCVSVHKMTRNRFTRCLP